MGALATMMPLRCRRGRSRRDLELRNLSTQVQPRGPLWRRTLRHRAGKAVAVVTNRHEGIAADSSSLKLRAAMAVAQKLF